MIIKVRAPYSLLACDELDLSHEETGLVCAVDTLLQRMRKAELQGSVPNLTEFIKMHVEAAHEYYADFSGTDMVQMDLVAALTAAAVERELEKDPE